MELDHRMTSSKSADSPVLIGLYGTSSAQPWILGSAAGHDAYQLFNNLAIAMGWSWSTLNHPGPEGALWAMNDAHAPSEAQDGRIGWFQVGLNDDTGHLPMIPLVTCAWSTLARLGAADVDGVQVYVPIRKSNCERPRLSSSLAWFAASNPAHYVTVDVSYDVGECESPEVIDVLAATGWTTAPFILSAATDPSGWTELFPEVPVDVWMGSIRQPNVLSAQLPEWTPEAVGWLAGLLVDGLRTAGVDSPALISIRHRPHRTPTRADVTTGPDPRASGLRSHARD